MRGVQDRLTVKNALLCRAKASQVLHMYGRRYCEIDTSSWGVKEWRKARPWNAVALVTWILFGALAVISSLPTGHWLLITAMLSIGIAGNMIQCVELLRSTLWLCRHSTTRTS